MALRYLTLRASKKLKDHRFNWIVHHIQEIYLHLFPKDIEINNSTKIAIIFGPIGDEPVWNSVLGVTSYYIENFDFDNFYRLNKIEQENLILEIVNNTIVNISERNGKNKDAKQKIIAAKNKVKDIKFSMEIDIKKLSKISLDKKYKINIYRILNKESGEGWKYIKLNRKTKEIIEEHWINEIPDYRDLTDYYKKAEIKNDGYILYNNLRIMVYKITESEYLQYKRRNSKMYKKIIKYAPTSHNRSVYAAPAVAGLASIRLGRLRLPRLIAAHLGGTQTYGLLYCAAQTS